MTEPSSGSLHAAMASRRLPVPLRQVALDTGGKPTVAWDPGSYGTPAWATAYVALTQQSLRPVWFATRSERRHTTGDRH